MDNSFRFGDEFGPAKMVTLYNQAVGLKAVVAIDNVAAGPAIGGTRMAVDVSVEECFRLARAMTFKNAAAGLPHGGAKSVIFADPSMSVDKKEVLIRAFARAIKDLSEYIPGPDMGTNELTMAWIHDETGRAVGLPSAIGGIPLDEIGATGFGLSVAAGVLEEFSALKLDGARIAVQGFGAVGRHAARFLREKGSILVAAADSRGAIHDPCGLDVEKLLRLKVEGASVVQYGGAKTGPAESIIATDCDILIPAARPDVISLSNVETVKAQIILQGANIPVTIDAERRLHEKGTLSIPDFIANSGGVIAASVEFHGGSEDQAMTTIAHKIAPTLRGVLEGWRTQNLPPRHVANDFARARVQAAMRIRRFHSCLT